MAILSAGVHTTIDAFVKDPKKVFTKEHIDNFLIGLAKLLDMKILRGPDCIEVPLDPEILRKAQETGIFHDEGGLTSFCVINKSHLALHAWPLQSFFSFCAFSCDMYDPEVVLNYTIQELGVKKGNTNIIYRMKTRRAEVKSFVLP